MNETSTHAAASVSLPTYDDVVAAAQRIAGIAHRTPVLTSRTADARADTELFFKAENLQRAGAFKFRGAYNAIARLSDDAKRRGVVAFSSGNHAQAIAYAGQLQRVPTVIIMPEDAPAMKVAATKAYGGEVQVTLEDGSTKSLSDLARSLAQRTISIFLPDEEGYRPMNGPRGTRKAERFAKDPHWRDYVLFFEYFNGDTGEGLGASHQTGWTGLVANLIDEWR